MHYFLNMVVKREAFPCKVLRLRSDLKAGVADVGKWKSLGRAAAGLTVWLTLQSEESGLCRWNGIGRFSRLITK